MIIDKLINARRRIRVPNIPTDYLEIQKEIIKKGNKNKDQSYNMFNEKGGESRL